MKLSSLVPNSLQNKVDSANREVSRCESVLRQTRNTVNTEISRLKSLVQNDERRCNDHKRLKPPRPDHHFCRIGECPTPCPEKQRENDAARAVSDWDKTDRKLSSQVSDSKNSLFVYENKGRNLISGCESKLSQAKTVYQYWHIQATTTSGLVLYSINTNDLELAKKICKSFPMSLSQWKFLEKNATWSRDNTFFWYVISVLKEQAASWFKILNPYIVANNNHSLPNPNQHGPDGDTPLHSALNLNSIPILEYLLSHPEITPDLLNKQQQSPIVIACVKPYFSLFKGRHTAHGVVLLNTLLAAPPQNVAIASTCCDITVSIDSYGNNIMHSICRYTLPKQNNQGIKFSQEYFNSIPSSDPEFRIIKFVQAILETKSDFPWLTTLNSSGYLPITFAITTLKYYAAHYQILCGYQFPLNLPPNRDPVLFGIHSPDSSFGNYISSVFVHQWFSLHPSEVLTNSKITEPLASSFLSLLSYKSSTTNFPCIPLVVLVQTIPPLFSAGSTLPQSVYQAVEQGDTTFLTNLINSHAESRRYYGPLVQGGFAKSALSYVSNSELYTSPVSQNIVGVVYENHNNHLNAMIERGIPGIVPLQVKPLDMVQNFFSLVMNAQLKTRIPSEELYTATNNLDTDYPIFSLLAAAILTNNETLLKYCLASGSNPNVGIIFPSEKLFLTPLLLAIWNADANLALKLVQHGADLTLGSSINPKYAHIMSPKGRMKKLGSKDNIPNLEIGIFPWEEATRLTGTCQFDPIFLSQLDPETLVFAKRRLALIQNEMTLDSFNPEFYTPISNSDLATQSEMQNVTSASLDREEPNVSTSGFISLRSWRNLRKASILGKMEIYTNMTFDPSLLKYPGRPPPEEMIQLPTVPRSSDIRVIKEAHLGEGYNLFNSPKLFGAFGLAGPKSFPKFPNFMALYDHDKASSDDFLGMIYVAPERFQSDQLVFIRNTWIPKKFPVLPFPFAKKPNCNIISPSKNFKIVGECIYWISFIADDPGSRKAFSDGFNDIV